MKFSYVAYFLGKNDFAKSVNFPLHVYFTTTYVDKSRIACLPHIFFVSNHQKYMPIHKQKIKFETIKQIGPKLFPYYLSITH